MILECPSCKAQFSLDPYKLGVAGKRVRCTDCQNVWFEPPAGAGMKDPLLQRTLVSELSMEEKPHPVTALPPDEAPAEDDADADFEKILSQVVSTDEPPAIPSSVMPLPMTSESVLAAPVYRFMGMGSFQFGLLVFLALLFSSAIVLLLGKNLIAHHIPRLAPVYAALGVPVETGSEGLRLGGMVAEQRIHNEKKTLAVQAMIANLRQEEKDYPALQVVARDEKGHELKTWDVLPEKNTKKLMAGEERPIKLEFGTVPKDMAQVDIQIFKP